MERRAIAVRGTVQGVGFRPFVHGLASRLGLRGFVNNSSGGVRIEVEGEAGRLDQFLSDLTAMPPPLARIEDVAWERRPPRGEVDFRIAPSSAEAAGPVVISADVGTCEDCLRELFDPRDRRFRYPFLNCTNCGPRLTIVCGAPYDRERTTMAGFGMCAACRAEYEDQADRRFHAQPIACPVCGPRLRAADAQGRAVATGDAIGWFVDAIRGGKIGAMKGLGGYHLVCDARNDAAVAELRRRKNRYEKPFAVMVGGMGAAEALCEVAPEEAAQLSSSRRPIVLLAKRLPCGVAEAVAPGNPLLGMMLPYTPLHHLLMREMGDVPLVMTSGNRSDEPIAYEEPDAFERLAGIADVFLTHDRPIHVRCDDSVTRVIGGCESPLRRSRGYAPQPVRLPARCGEAVLAVGGQLKSTFALGREEHAILSHHLGDLDNFAAYRAFERDVALYERLFEIHPRRIVHDLHPDYASTRYSIRRAAAEGLALLAVQHHHAHMASCMAEHGLDGPVIGVTFDGTGYGADGAAWGGEFLVGGYHEFRRAAHLRYVRMPGGEQAVREPWRMALAHAADAGADCPSLAERVDHASARVVRQMLERGLNAPFTSSAGRLFDAVASLIGVRDRVTYEGQAAIQLEWLAARVRADGAYPFAIGGSECGTAGGDCAAREVDTRPIIRAVADEVARGTDPALIARRFHSTIAELITHVCTKIHEETGIDKIALSGGVFMNALLVCDAEDKLRAEGFLVFRQRLVPPNDGGLSLGQLAIASRMIESQ
ncbi:MAG: hypF [Phycisphaerales bacterium]|nr:hypF [Phycisphaerales bacterium]